MLQLRRAQDRGLADHGWLKSFHTFSFADYHDPAHMGFGNLRVINEDRIAPGTGFGTHGHRDMEIVSVVLAGELSHQDSLGHRTVIRPGEIQRMTAGTGVRHSEFNHAPGEETHFLQIWLLPAARGLTPGYDQRAVDPQAVRGRLHCVASPQGAGDALQLNADASLYLGTLDGEATATLPLAAGRRAWVQVLRGQLRAQGHTLAAGDGLALWDEPLLSLSHGMQAEVLVFDLAA
ncbi:pirin family protein [Ideonella livida]|uniref:Pirin family protein n=1 Tax=Ideonella livida TaxID=2707176 RepID=A0A7C9TKB8_9BURK|nr:pirin family protein [Ideonella livida]NDY91205.1 pirin family protein [Ideonella livida]